MSQGKKPQLVNDVVGDGDYLGVVFGIGGGLTDKRFPVAVFWAAGLVWACCG